MSHVLQAGLKLCGWFAWKLARQTQRLSASRQQHSNDRNRTLHNKFAARTSCMYARKAPLVSQKIRIRPTEHMLMTRGNHLQKWSSFLISLSLPILSPPFLAFPCFYSPFYTFFCVSFFGREMKAPSVFTDRTGTQMVYAVHRIHS